MCCAVQGANRAAEDPERARRDREEILGHRRNPAARGMMPSSSGRPRGTQEVAPPTPLTPTSHTGEMSTAACRCLFFNSEVNILRYFFFVHKDYFDLQDAQGFSFSPLLQIKTDLYSSATFFPASCCRLSWQEVVKGLQATTLSRMFARHDLHLLAFALSKGGGSHTQIFLQERHLNSDPALVLKCMASISRASRSRAQSLINSPYATSTGVPVNVMFFF